MTRSEAKLFAGLTLTPGEDKTTILGCVSCSWSCIHEGEYMGEAVDDLEEFLIHDHNNHPFEWISYGPIPAGPKSRGFNNA